MASSRTRRATGRLIPKRPQMMFVACGLDRPTRSAMALVRRVEARKQIGPFNACSPGDLPPHSRRRRVRAGADCQVQRPARPAEAEKPRPALAEEVRPAAAEEARPGLARLCEPWPPSRALDAPEQGA